MSTKSYQIRIRKNLENTEIHKSAVEFLGACIIAEIRTLHGKFSIA